MTIDSSVCLQLHSSSALSEHIKREYIEEFRFAGRRTGRGRHRELMRLPFPLSSIKNRYFIDTPTLHMRLAADELQINGMTRSVLRHVLEQLALR